MKIKTTKKSIKESYNTIIKLGYCDIQHLTRFIDPFAYSTRTEGWSCDYFEIENVCISTGYSPIGNIKPSYETSKKYNEQAEAILYSDEVVEIKKEKINQLLKDFVNEVTK